MGRGGGKRGRSPGRGPGRSRGTRRCRSELRVSPADTTSAHSISTGRAPSVPPVCAPPTPRRRDTASDVPAGASAPGTEDGAGAAILASVGGGQVVNDTGSAALRTAPLSAELGHVRRGTRALPGTLAAHAARAAVVNTPARSCVGWWTHPPRRGRGPRRLSCSWSWSLALRLCRRRRTRFRRWRCWLSSLA